MLLICSTTEIFNCFNCVHVFQDHNDNKHVHWVLQIRKCAFPPPPPPRQVKVCISACPNSGGGAPVVSVRITTSNVVPYFQLMGLFLHRQSFSPWGICSLCVKSFATVPLYSPSIWRHLANERQALWRFQHSLNKAENDSMWRWT